MNLPTRRWRGKKTKNWEILETEFSSITVLTGQEKWWGYFSPNWQLMYPETVTSPSGAHPINWIFYSLTGDFSKSYCCENFPQTSDAWKLSVFFCLCQTLQFTPCPPPFFLVPTMSPLQTSISSHNLVNFPFCPPSFQSMTKVSFLLDKWIKLRDVPSSSNHSCLRFTIPIIESMLSAWRKVRILGWKISSIMPSCKWCSCVILIDLSACIQTNSLLSNPNLAWGPRV